MFSCTTRIDKLDIRDYENKFKYRQLTTFDAKTLMTDLTAVHDKALLNNLWEDMDKNVEVKNYFYSLQDGADGNQEFTVVLGDLQDINAVKQIWFFVYDRSGNQLSRFIIAELDRSNNTHIQAKINEDGSFSVTFYEQNDQVNSKNFTIDNSGMLQESVIPEATAEEITDRETKSQKAVSPESGARKSAAPEEKKVVHQDYYPSDVFTQKKLVFAGIDFSKTKFVGSVFNNTNELRNKSFVEWNDILVNEKKKFNVQGFFRKNEIIYDFSGTYSRNGRRSTDDLIAYGSAPVFRKSQVQDILYGVSVNLSSGIGLILIAESYNKETDEAAVWVTLFDISSKKLLITDRLTGKPKGAGMRNYWSNAIFDILSQVDKFRYRSWENTYR
jgi:hypothetical protein